jgi:tetratricopeptide (TPR) repeat protein
MTSVYRARSLPLDFAINATGNKHWLLLALLVIAPLVVFARTWQHGLLHWDDTIHITENPHLAALSPGSLVALWRHGYFGLYIPVFYTLLAIETVPARIIGPGVYHFGSTMVHVVNVLLVFALLRRLVGGEAAAACGALFFALHPLQVESVAWVSETRGLLATAFGLASILLYLRWRDQQTAPAVDRAGRPMTIAGARPASTRYAAALGLFVLALLSKPSAVAIPLILAIVEFGWLRRGAWRTAVALAPWFAMGLLSAIINKTQQGGESIAFLVPVWDRPRLAGDAIAFYLYKFVWPWNLATDYGRSAKSLIDARWTWLTAAVPLVLLALLGWRRQWRLFLAASIFVVALLPVAGLVPFAFQDISTVADRYAYLAMVGPALALGCWLASHQSDSRNLATAGLLAVLAAISFVQAGYWRDEERLFRHTLRVNPKSYIAEEKIGMDLYRRGQAERAISHLLAAEGINPQFGAAYNNAGTIFSQLKRWPEAADQLAMAARLKPDDALIQFNLGQALWMQQKESEAEPHLAAAVRLAPRMIDARLAYSHFLAARGDRQGALAQLDAVLAIDPYHAKALCGKARILHDMGNLTAAEVYYTAALRVDATNQQARQGLDRIRADRVAPRP